MFLTLHDRWKGRAGQACHTHFSVGTKLWVKSLLRWEHKIFWEKFVSFSLCLMQTPHILPCYWTQVTTVRSRQCNLLSYETVKYGKIFFMQKSHRTYWTLQTPTLWAHQRTWWVGYSLTQEQWTAASSGHQRGCWSLFYGALEGPKFQGFLAPVKKLYSWHTYTYNIHQYDILVKQWIKIVLQKQFSDFMSSSWEWS